MIAFRNSNKNLPVLEQIVKMLPTLCSSSPAIVEICSSTGEFLLCFLKVIITAKHHLASFTDR
jgi:hypothetical protein